MIGIGHSIRDTSGSIAYGWNKDKGAEVVLRQNLVGENPMELTREFHFIQSQNSNCYKNTLSFVLSPTIEDGKKLSLKDLKEICWRFMEQMKLGDRQGIGFVHRDKAHRHIHLYVNRIDFRGNAYNNSFMSRRCQLAAEQVAKQMNLKTVRAVTQDKLQALSPVRNAIKQKHDLIIKNRRPKNFDQYIKAMKQNGVTAVPSINKAGNLQGFRFIYKEHSFKGSAVHPEMSAGNLALQIYGSNRIRTSHFSHVKILDKIIPITPKLIVSIAKKAMKRSLDVGIEI